MKVLMITNTDAKKINHIVDAFQSNDTLHVKVVHQKLQRETYSLTFVEKLLFKLKLPADFEKLNDRIIQACQAFKPEIVIIIKGNIVKPTILKKIKFLLPSAALISWSLDDMFAWHNRSLYYTWGLKYYDHVFTTKSYNMQELKTLGAKNLHFLYQTYSSQYHLPCNDCSNTIFNYDVLFIGAAEKERIESLNFLALHGINVEIYGGGWNKINKETLHTNLHVHEHDLLGKDYADAISCSKIALCFLRKINRDLHTSRSIEIPACKGFMVAERTSEHLELFEENKEAVYFSSNQELLEKVLYYLKHDDEREKIVQCGYERCLSSGYSYDNMVTSILQEIL